MAEWQPISMAPKDGTRLLIALDTIEKTVTIAAWTAAVDHPAFIDDSGDSHFRVSGWMPLPLHPLELELGVSR